MRKIWIAAVLLLSGVLAGCDVEKMGSLRSLSRPYAGVYRCESLLLAGRDYAEEYPLTLELAYGGDFTLTMAGRELRGKYTADCERGELTLTAEGRTRTYRYEEGEVLVTEDLGGHLLAARFVR